METMAGSKGWAGWATLKIGPMSNYIWILVQDEILQSPNYKFAIVCIYYLLKKLFASIYLQKKLFASISRWVGNRIKGCYIVGL